MLALIGTFKDEQPIVREIATWLVAGGMYEYVDDEGEAYMDSLRNEWPEATDDDITRGHNLAYAVAKTVKRGTN
ncbi:hypothetical protein [Methyloceanibacter sp.]|uniref:hypothetical protein n=1 Tax=Methyloceanibacter sp. TaxID=1965321 RepID=UPI002D1FB066|nr:hypothetical protein [Methyloceanibacter sp.]